MLVLGISSPSNQIGRDGVMRRLSRIAAAARPLAVADAEQGVAQMSAAKANAAAAQAFADRRRPDGIAA